MLKESSHFVCTNSGVKGTLTPDRRYKISIVAHVHMYCIPYKEKQDMKMIAECCFYKSFDSTKKKELKFQKANSSLYPFIEKMKYTPLSY
jgi:hypothetical protein